MSWRTLRKHNKYNIKDEVESLGGEDAGAENQDPFMPSLSMTTLGSSKEHLIPAEKVCTLCTLTLLDYEEYATSVQLTCIF